MKKRIISALLFLAIAISLVPTLGIESTAITTREDLYNAVKVGDVHGYNVFLAWYHTMFMGEGRDESLHEYCESLLYNNFAKLYSDEWLRTGFLEVWASANGKTRIEAEDDLYSALLLKMVIGDLDSKDDDAAQTYNTIKTVSKDFLAPFLEEVCIALNLKDVKDVIPMLVLYKDDENVIKKLQEHFKGNKEGIAIFKKFGETLDVVFKVLDHSNNALMFLDKMSTICAISKDSDDLQAVIFEIMKSTDNTLIRNAAGELYTYMQTSDFTSMLLQLASEVIEGTLEYATDALLKCIWDGISKINPGIKIGMDFADLLFDVTGEAESIYTMMALTKIEDAIFDASVNLRRKFLNKQNIYTASEYIASLEMCYRFAILTNEYVENHLEVIFKSGVFKELIKDQDTYRDYMKTLSESKVYLKSAHKIFYSEPLKLYDEVKSELGSVFTINYDANGGTDSPSSQTKEFDTSVYITNEEPIRSGYKFIGWAENKNAKTQDYVAGDMYNANRDVTLYAVWREIYTSVSPLTSVYTVIYKGNAPEGSVSNIPAKQDKGHDQSITISNEKPLRDGYSFLGWSTSSVSTVADNSFAPGSTYANNSNMVLYAVWKKNSVVGDGLPGDIDGDGQVTNRDLMTLRKYLNGESVSVDSKALNVDGIGDIDENDHDILFKFLTNWNVTMYYGVGEPENTEIKVTSAEYGDILVKNGIEIANKANSLKWNISSSHDWTVSSSASWCTFDKTSGKAGNSTLTVIVNGKTDSERDAIVTFSVNGETRTVVISQCKAVFSINHKKIGDILAQDTVQVANEVGADMNWTITSNYDWKIVNVDGKWFSLDRTSGNAGQSVNLKITTTSFASTGKNEGEITFGVNGDTYSVVIYQQGPDIIEELSAPIISKDENEKNKTTISWNAVEGANGYYVYRRIKDYELFWGEPIMDTKATTINDHSFEYYTSYEYMVRAYYNDGITIKTSGDSNIVEAYIKDYTLSVDTKNIDVLWNKGNEAIFNVSSREEITVECIEGSDSWLTCKKNNNTVECTTKSVNYSDFARVGKIKISNEGNYVIVTVTQSAINEASPTISLSDANDLNSIKNGQNIGMLTDTLTFNAHTLNVRKIHVRVIPVNGLSNVASATKYPDGGSQLTQIDISLKDIPDGDYEVIVYSSNSSVDNDPTAQKPNDIKFYFTKGSSTIEVPQNVSAVLRNDDSVRISWDSVSGATGYRVYRKLNSNSSWQKIADTTLTYNNDYGVEKGNVYYYYVEAYAKRSSGEITAESSSVMIELEDEVVFKVTHTYSGDLLANSPIKLANETGASMNCTVTSSHDWFVNVTKGSSWLTAEKTSNTSLKITTTNYALPGNRNEGVVKFTVNGKTYTIEFYQQAETKIVFNITHPEIGDVMEEQPIGMHNGDAVQTWTINSSHSWSAKSSASWCTFNGTGSIRTTGVKGESKLILNINGSTSSSRSATITFTVENKTFIVEIYQEAEAQKVDYPKTLSEAQDIVTLSRNNKPVSVKKGMIRHMPQITGYTNFCDSYWKNSEYDLTKSYTESSGTSYTHYCHGLCTRAVYSMALSYLGIDCTPVEMTAMMQRYEIDAPYTSITKKLNDNNSFTLTHIKKSGSKLKELFNNYASDSSYSPIYLHYKRTDGKPHCVLVIGKDSGNTYYIVDPSVRNNIHVYSMEIDETNAKILSCSGYPGCVGATFTYVNQWKLD